MKMLSFLAVAITVFSLIFCFSAGAEDIFTQEMKDYLSLIMTKSELKTLLNRARANMTLNNIDACSALHYEMRQKNLHREATEAIRLMAPPVCNKKILHLLRTIPMQPFTPESICSRARGIMACSNLNRAQALEKVLREKALLIPEINEDIIDKALKALVSD